ncbi:MAG: TrmB protein [Thermoproteota archaeon]|nr:TrmB protein [Thermoproteota archaeon]
MKANDEHIDEVLKVLRSHSAFELAEHYLFDLERFCSLLLEVLNLGTLATKVFITLYQNRREFTTTELTRMVEDHRPNVYVALCRLQEKNYVERVSRNKWRLSERV